VLDVAAEDDIEVWLDSKTWC